MSETILHIDEIVTNPNVRRGRPVLRGTGLRVMDIVNAMNTPDRFTAEEVAHNYRLPLGQIYAALAYYHLHKDEIDADIQSDNEEAERLIKELEARGKLRRFD
jgi:uncharacterized protein (DUF433 family)